MNNSTLHSSGPIVDSVISSSEYVKCTPSSPPPCLLGVILNAKRNKLILYIACGLCFFIAGPVFAAGDACEGITLEGLQKHQPLPNNTEILSKQDVKGICEIILQANGQVSYLYATREYAISGRMFSSGQQPTEDHFRELRANVFLAQKKALDDAAAFTYKPEGKIRHTVYMFSSPDCAYCTQALTKIKPILDATHSELKVLFPVSGDARVKAIEAICKKVDLDIYNSGTWMSKEGQTHSSCERGDYAVNNAIAISQKLWVRNLPTFFLENGYSIVGAQMPLLEKALSIEN